MQISKETPTGPFVIQGHTFQIPRPFSEGHVCTGAEAGVLNQTLAENVRNNMANTVAKAAEEAEKSGSAIDASGLQAKIDEYLEEYEFGVRRGRGPLDPVDREALNIAKDYVKEALRKAGHKLADISTEDINRLADDLLKENPQVRTVAEKRVKEREKIGEVKLSLDNLGASDDEAEAAE